MWRKINIAPQKIRGDNGFMVEMPRYEWMLTAEELEAALARREAERLADLELSERLGREMARERLEG